MELVKLFYPYFADPNNDHDIENIDSILSFTL